MSGEGNLVRLKQSAECVPVIGDGSAGQAGGMLIQHVGKALQVLRTPSRLQSALGTGRMESVGMGLAEEEGCPAPPASPQA
jgi:hypothetical protein